jgi:uncharacterized protein (DUF433 family)
MKYESSHLEKPVAKKETPYTEEAGSWATVMSIPEDDIEFDDDCPELDLRYAIGPTVRIKGRIVPPRKSPTDPFDPEVLEFIKSLNPLVQVEPEILGGMPVFKGTFVPIKRMFDYLLSGKSIPEFLNDFPSVPPETAVGVLETEATLFYEEISKAIDSAAMPSSLPR